MESLPPIEKIWVKKDNKIYKVWSIDFIIGLITVVVPISKEVLTFRFHEVEPIRYLGVKDKNGKKIYTDDIVFLTYVPGAGRRKRVIHMRGDGGMPLRMPDLNFVESMEVLGNSHEDTGLLYKLQQEIYR